MHVTGSGQQNRYRFEENSDLKAISLERHSASSAELPQLVEIEVEVTEKDLENMQSMQKNVEQLTERAGSKYVDINKLQQAKSWKLDEIAVKDRFAYHVRNGNLEPVRDSGKASFLQYLKMFEMVATLREEFGFAPLSMPLVYLPVNRTASGFQSNVELASYNDSETKRHSDAEISKSATSIVKLAIGRLAQKYRLLLEEDMGQAMQKLREDKDLRELTKVLGRLGYEWLLKPIDALKNKYDVYLVKQGFSFPVSAASSGERELITYLLAIFALKVRDAFIIVDEPELHLHPKWQKTLLQIFVQLADSTKNQFLLATHSPTFVSPESIQYVSRVYSHEKQGRILRLDTEALPDARHLLNIVNSQNNERLFFADEVVLVEGLSDRIFFEAVLDRYGRSSSTRAVLEVISVGGKGFFEAYTKVLKACHTPYSIIADLDYIEQVGTPEIQALFKTDAKEIKEDVVDNGKSLDGAALVQAIDKAVSSGSWNNASKVWNYIKTRHRHLRIDLSERDEETLSEFLELKRRERVYILKRGSLEAYLPDGHASKDLDKLICLLAGENFWEKLPEDGKDELDEIARRLLPEEGLRQAATSLEHVEEEQAIAG
jgi:hypothetical protein